MVVRTIGELATTGTCTVWLTVLAKAEGAISTTAIKLISRVLFILLTPNEYHSGTIPDPV